MILEPARNGAKGGSLEGVSMGLILIFAVFFAVGIVLCVRDDADWHIPLGVTLNVVAGVALFAAGLVAIITQTDQPSVLAGYQQDKARIEAAVENDSLTDAERSSVMDLMLRDNLIITENKIYRDSFMLGAFYQYDVGSLPLFDFKKVQKAKLNVDLVGE